MKTRITIGRQFGSSGHEIGRKVAEKLGIPCYDKEIITATAKNSGFCEEMIENHDERPTSSFLYNLVMDTYSFGYNNSTYVDMPISQKVFLAQFNAIKDLADESPCVIVGRCADYALADRNDTLNIFIFGNEDVKIKTIMNRFPELNEGKARDMMVKKDKQRQSYYNYYSSKKWGRADTYDLCINSSTLGVDGTVDLICQYVNDFENKKS
jgi:cytidylate kinase